MSIIFYSIRNFILHILRNYVNPMIGKILFLIGFKPNSNGTHTNIGVEIESCGFWRCEDPMFYCGRFVFPIPKSWYIRYANTRFTDQIYF